MIIIVTVTLFFTKSFTVTTKHFEIVPKMKILINEENSLNSMCEKINLTFTDAIARLHMKNKQGRIECDIFDDNYFIEINDHSIYDPEKHSVNYGLLKKLQNQDLLIDNDETLQLDQYFYSMRLNIDELVIRTNEIYENISCKVQKFDKILKQPESFVLKVFKSRFFNENNNYTLYFKKHGLYHVSCYNAVRAKTRIYDDSFLILPRNMSILVEERKYYKSLEIKGSKLSNDGDEEDIKFLKEDNKFKIDKKMNVLMTGFDSLSYQHFQRVLPQTFHYLSNILENNIMFTSVNRVGENTHPNLIGMLTGIYISDIPSINVTSEFPDYQDLDNDFYDKYPFIWYRYEKAGYVTGLQVTFIFYLFTLK